MLLMYYAVFSASSFLSLALSLSTAFSCLPVFITIVASTCAPSSTESLAVVMSPWMYDSDINERVSEIRICPLIEPETSALEQLNFPVIFPDLPTTTFPVVVILPSTLPSILKSALEIISPTILVDDSITSTEGDEKN